MLENLERASLNTKKVWVNQPAPSIDIAKTITSGQWELILGTTLDSFGQDDYPWFLQQLSHIHLLDPSKVKEISPTGSILNLLNDCFKESYADNPRDIAWPLSALAIFSPSLVGALHINESWWKKLSKNFNTNTDTPLHLLDNALALKLNGKDIPKASQVINRLSSIGSLSAYEEHISEYIRLSRNLRLLNPTEQLVSDTDLNEIKEEVLTARENKEWEYFAEVASGYRVLMAEKLIMTNNGIILQMPKEEVLDDQRGQFPQRRIF